MNENEVIMLQKDAYNDKMKAQIKKTLRDVPMAIPVFKKGGDCCGYSKFAA